jgi:hypothetical protein
MKGIDLETCKVEDPLLVMEVLEERELLETANEEELKKALARYQAIVDKTIKAAEDLLQLHNDAALTPITHLIVRAQYFDKLAEQASAMLEGPSTSHSSDCNHC